MSQNKKKILLSIGMIVLSAILKYKIPHKSITVFQAIFKPLQNNNSILHYFNLLPLFLLIIAIFLLINLNQSSRRNQIILFLALIIILPLFLDWTSNLLKSSYYWIHDDTLNALDITESKVDLQITNDKVLLNVEFTVVNYGRHKNNFSYRIHVPKSVSSYSEKEFYDSTLNYTSTSGQQKQKITEVIELPLKEGYTPTKVLEDFFKDDVTTKNLSTENATYSKWLNEAVDYDLFNEEETVIIHYHDPSVGVNK